MKFYKNTFIKNNFVVLLFQAIPIFAALIFIPKNIAKIGADAWGGYTLATTTIFLTMYFNLGVGPAVNKSLSFYSDKKLDKELTIIQTGFLINFLSSIVFVLVLYFLNEGILNFIANKELNAEVVSSNKKLFKYAAIASGLYLNLSFFRNIFESQGSFSLVNLMRSIFSSSVLIIPFFFDRTSIHLAMVVLNVIILIQILIYIFILMNKLEKVNLATFIRFKEFKPILSDGIKLSIHSLINPIFIFLDRYLIGILIGLTTVGLYTSVYDLISRITIVASAISTVLYPKIAQAAFNFPLRMKLIKSSIGLILTICTVPCLVLFFYGTGIFEWWLNTKLTNYSVLIKLLTIAYLLQGINLILIKSFQSSGYISLTIKTSTYLAIIYVPALYLLIKYYGITGVGLVLLVKNCIEMISYILRINFLKIHKVYDTI